MRKIVALAILLASPLAAAVYSQTAPPPPPTPGGRGSDNFVEVRKLHLEKGESALAATGRGSNLTGIRSAVRATMRTKAWSIQPSGATPEILREQDVEAVSQALASLGYTPRDVAPGALGAAELIQSASRVVLGGSTLSDQVRITPTLVLVDFQGLEEAPNTDFSYRSNANVKVRESLKGGLAEGAGISMRQRSGRGSDGSRVQLPFEFSPQSEGTYLLFLSSAALEVRNRGKGNSPRPTEYALVLVPLKLEGDTLQPIADCECERATMSQIRSLAR